MFAETTCLDRIKFFDVYRKMPSDYMKPSYCGALCNLNLLIKCLL